ncbi:MAG: hypothetical protein ABFR97_12045 [Thermodesulfobacteriota bacterium]
MRVSLLFLALLLLAHPPALQAEMELFALAGEDGPLRVNLRVSGETVAPGEDGRPQVTTLDPIDCLLRITAPEESRLRVEGVGPESWGDFSLTARQETRRQLNEQGLLVTSMAWQLSPPGPGPWPWPELRVTARLAEEDGYQVRLSAGQELAVAAVTAGADILPPLPAPEAKTSFVGPGVLVLIFLLIGALVILGLWLWRHRSGPIGPSPSQQARQLLAPLAATSSPGPEQAGELAAIVRGYLAQILARPLQGRTAVEIGPELAASALAAEEQERIKDILDQCELWQFRPGEEVTGAQFQELLARVGALVAATEQPGPEDKRRCGRW